jgi:hypothetical protein
MHIFLEINILLAFDVRNVRILYLAVMWLNSWHHKLQGNIANFKLYVKAEPASE